MNVSNLSTKISKNYKDQANLFRSKALFSCQNSEKFLFCFYSDVESLLHTQMTKGRRSE